MTILHNAVYMAIGGILIHLSEKTVEALGLDLDQADQLNLCKEVLVTQCTTVPYPALAWPQ